MVLIVGHEIFIPLYLKEDNNFLQRLIENKKRYVLFLYVKSLGNLLTAETRDDIMVATYMRGAVIPTSVSKGFS